MIKHIEINQIIIVICNYFNMTPDILLSRSRKRYVVEIRQIFHFFAIKYSKFSLEAIGRNYGNYDHTTVSFSRKTVSNLIDTIKPYKERIDELELLLQPFIITENIDVISFDTNKKKLKKRISMCYNITELNNVLSNFITENHNQLT